MNVLEYVQEHKCKINPGFFIQDVCENVFAQIRTIRNGTNTHPTLSQIGPSINTNLVVGTVVTWKSNCEGQSRSYKGVFPPDSISKGKKVLTS